MEIFKRAIVFFICTSAIVGAVVYFQQPPAPSTYSNSTYGVSLKYPSSWKLEETQDAVLGTSVVFKPAQTSLDCNLSLEFEDLTKRIAAPITLKKLTESEYSEMNKFYPEARLEYAGNVILAKRPARQLIYEDPATQIKRLRVWTIITNYAYIATYTAKKQDFESCLSDTKLMLESMIAK